MRPMLVARSDWFHGIATLVAAESCFNLGIGCERAALGLSEALEHIGKVRRVDLLRLILARQVEHGERNFVLVLRRQVAHGFESLFQELGHARAYAVGPVDWKRLRRQMTAGPRALMAAKYHPIGSV